APAEPARAAAFRRAVLAASAGSAAAAPPAPVDRETAQKLAALGYIGAGAVATDSDGAAAARPDPKAMVDAFNRLREANTALRERRFTAAAEAARAVLLRDERNAFATMILARAELETGQYRAAAAGYQRYGTL